MNRSPLKLALGLAALLGGALLLPTAASAHGSVTVSHGGHGHHHHKGKDWYLLRHREGRHHRSQSHVVHINGTRHQHRHGHRHHSPVRVKIVL